MENWVFDQEEQKLYKRAAQLAASSNENDYVAFLCQEILKRNPDHLESRQLLLNLRRSGTQKTKIQRLVIFLKALGRMVFLSFRFKKKKKECLNVLDSLLEIYLKWDMVWRLMSHLAIQLEYFNTAIFCIENIDHNQRKMSDVIRLGEAYLGCGHFAGAVDVANFILEREPENIKARDLLWQSSVEDTLGKQEDSKILKSIVKNRED
jgi:tetratricopeptide (TPR) repeat protein